MDELGCALAIARTAAQIVQMRHRNLGQTRVRLLAKHLPLALQNPACGRPAQALMRAVDFNQQRQILHGVLGRKPPPHALAHANLSALAVAPDQPRDLR